MNRAGRTELTRSVNERERRTGADIGAGGLGGIIFFGLKSKMKKSERNLSICKSIMNYASVNRTSNN